MLKLISWCIGELPYSCQCFQRLLWTARRKWLEQCPWQNNTIRTKICAYICL